MKKFIIYISVLSLGMLSSCKKYLDTVPDNRTEINTPEKISELLVGAYPRAGYSSFCEIMSDNAGDKGVTNLTNESYLIEPYFWKDFTTYDIDTPQYYWAACYKAIAASNQALVSIKALGDTPSLAPQKGEALVARAYAHFMLVNLFSKFYDASTAATDMGIPYVTEPENVPIKQYDRKTVAYVYEMIEKDLLAGLPLINDAVYKVPSFHFTQPAANAFASRFYLYKKNYDKVIEYANKVAAVTNNFTQRMRNWNNSGYNAMSYNEIAATYAHSTEPANLLLAETQSVWGRYFASGRYQLTFDILNETFFASTSVGGSWAYQLYGSNETVRLPKYNEHFVRTDPNANVGDPYVMIPLFSVEEVLFNRAEANLYKGNTTDVLADLNTFLSFRITGYNAATHTLTIAKNNTWNGSTNTNNNLLGTILHFRQLEFMHEGMRWFDILRYKATITHATADGQKYTLTATDLRKVLQIPQEATLSGLPKNPR